MTTWNQRISPRAWVRRLASHGLQQALYWTGAASVLRGLVPSYGATILMYHSIPDPAVAPFIDPANALSPHAFRAQMEFLARNRNVISLDSLVDLIDRGVRVPAGTVVVTFDDGYRDNLTVAAPILTALQLPGTVFLATAYIERAEPQWIDRLYTAFAHRTQSVLRILDCEWTLATTGALREAYQTLRRHLLGASLSEREAVLRLVEEQLAPGATPPRLTLSWEDVRRLVREHPQLSLGAHTHGHIDLTSVEQLEAEGEVRQSMERIEAEVGQAARHFSYPYGRGRAGFDVFLRGMGLRSAMASGLDTLVGTSADPFALARREAPDSSPRFALLTGGTHPGRGRGRRVQQ